MWKHNIERTPEIPQCTTTGGVWAVFPGIQSPRITLLLDDVTWCTGWLWTTAITEEVMEMDGHTKVSTEITKAPFRPGINVYWVIRTALSRSVHTWHLLYLHTYIKWALVIRPHVCGLYANKHLNHFHLQRPNVMFLNQREEAVHVLSLLAGITGSCPANENINAKISGGKYAK